MVDKYHFVHHCLLVLMRCPLPLCSAHLAPTFTISVIPIAIVPSYRHGSLDGRYPSSRQPCTVLSSSLLSLHYPLKRHHGFKTFGTVDFHGRHLLSDFGVCRSPRDLTICNEQNTCINLEHFLDPRAPGSMARHCRRHLQRFPSLGVVFVSYPHRIHAISHHFTHFCKAARLAPARLRTLLNPPIAPLEVFKAFPLVSPH